jgi:hypothetical protein
MHIYDFLTDTTQFGLKAQAQRIAPERFEDTLETYRQRFLQSFENVEGNHVTLSNKDKSKFMPEALNGDPDVQKWMDELLGITKALRQQIGKMFEEIINCYYLFIRGRHHTAVMVMYDILEKYELLDEAPKEYFGLFYRCANLWPGANPADATTYYHVPFNLRSKIKNQRFSVSGMPVWYGAGSLMCSYFEMRQPELKSVELLSISAWGFNPTAERLPIGDNWVRERTKIYDITNEIYDAINNTFFDYITIEDKDRKRNLFGNHHFIYRKHIRTALKKFALSNLCTFRSKSDGDHFHEEYVIPQLLTEAIRLHKYDGILFPSTQFVNKEAMVKFEGTVHTNFYKSNLAMFTEYYRHLNYDEELIKNFGIEILDKGRIDNVDSIQSREQISGFIKYIVNFLDYLPSGKEENLRAKIKSVVLQLERQLTIYNSVKIEETDYLHTYTGKAELLAINEYLSSLFSIIRHLCLEEFEQFQESQADKEISTE